MKPLIISLLLLLLYSNLLAQNNKDSIKHWKDGKLEWSDFQTKETSGILTSNLEQFIGYEQVKRKQNDTVYYLREIKSYMDRELSWVYKQARNSNTLKYNQVLFNIGQYHKRLLQKAVVALKYETEVQQELSNYVSASAKMISQMQQETNWGTNHAEVLSWENKIDELLLATSVSKIPGTTKQNFGIAFHYSLGGATHTGTFSDYFSHRMALSYGIDFAFKESLFSCNFYIDGITAQKNYNNTLVWEKGDRTSITLFDLSVGQMIYNGRKFRITPSIGYSFAQLNETYDKEKEDKGHYNSNNFTYGLSIDYKLKKKYRLFSSIWQGKMRYFEPCLRFRAQLTKVDFAPDLSGNIINFSVGFSSFSNGLKLKSN